MNEAIKAALNGAKVVSFDIFDTLITRIYRKPTDLFHHLEECMDMHGFYDARISGERKAREKASADGIAEVTLEQIYREMHSSYRNMMDQEIKLEILACRQNPAMKEVYDYCIKADKRVIIASDMYLPLPVVEAILANAGYSAHEKFFLSSDTLRPKATGQMYQDIISYAKVEAKDILHIGDHPYTDQQIAMENGLRSYLYLPVKDTCGNMVNSAFFSVLNRYEDTSVIPSVLEGLAVLHSQSNPEENYWENIGYKYAGILALSYAKWLKMQFDRENIHKAYFMLRDGYIFKRVFNVLYPDFETHEIFGSRSMFLLAGMDSYEDIRMHITEVHRQGLTYQRCYDRLAIEDENLYTKYKARFGNMEEIISDESHFAQIDAFFRENESTLKVRGSQERNTILEYFDNIDLLNGKSAIVDLGWKGSMLKGIEKICHIEERNAKLYGYYVGTHKFDPEGIRAVGFAINNGKPDDKYPVKSLLNYGYVIAVLELLFSAPHPSILKMQKSGSELEPTFQIVCAEEQKRMDISADVLSGVMEFVKDFEEICSKFPLKTNAELSLIPMEYIATSISRYDEMHLNQVCYFPGVGNDTTCYPITKNGTVKFGITFPWPGSKNAETEAIIRIRRAAGECGVECVPIDNYGHILDDSLNKISDNCFLDNADFVIATHFETHKVLDTYYYHALWNPPEYPLNGDYYDWVAKNYLMCDDYLIYDQGSMSNHLRSMLINCPRTLDGASPLMTTFPESAILKPDLCDPKIFYCGTNWDKMVTGTTRHEGILKLLDKANAIRIYGPEFVEGWGGVWPWEGYQCYQHPIPFDGFSLLKELNRCGVCLVVSSDVHRRAGAVTNRAFEACAAGAVIISDNNFLMQEMFQDAALFINYNRNDPADTYRQIMEKYTWILEHREEAQKLAERAQEIFRRKYTLNIFIANILKNHGNRFSTIAKDLFAKNDSAVVLVTYICNTRSLEQAQNWLDHVFKNIKNQYYQSILLVIAADQTIAQSLDGYCSQHCACAKVVAMKLFDVCGARDMTDGQVMANLRKKFPHDYFLNTNADETWYYDHITTLVRAIENEDAEGAYSGQLFVDCNGYKQTHLYDTITLESITTFAEAGCSPHQDKYPYPGCFLFKSSCHQYVPDFLFDCLDGREHIAYLHLLMLKYRKKFAFTRRMTFLFPDQFSDARHTVVNKEQERRFILDLTRYDLPLYLTGKGAAIERTEASTQAGRKELLAMISLLPLKAYIKMRYYRSRLRKTDASSEKGRKLSAKYEKTVSEYNRLMGVQ